MALTPERIDAVVLQCSNRYWVEHGSRFNHDFARAIEAEARRDALEEAAKKCESIARDDYGMTYLHEYGECAAAIRKLKEDTQ